MRATRHGYGGEPVEEFVFAYRIPYYGRLQDRPISVGPSLTWLDGRWTGELYPSPDRTNVRPFP